VSVVLLNEPKVAYRNKRLQFYGCVGISYSRFDDDDFIGMAANRLD